MRDLSTAGSNKWTITAAIKHSHTHSNPVLYLIPQKINSKNNRYGPSRGQLAAWQRREASVGCLCLYFKSFSSSKTRPWSAHGTLSKKRKESRMRDLIIFRKAQPFVYCLCLPSADRRGQEVFVFCSLQSNRSVWVSAWTSESFFNFQVFVSKMIQFLEHIAGSSSVFYEHVFSTNPPTENLLSLNGLPVNESFNATLKWASVVLLTLFFSKLLSFLLRLWCLCRISHE